MSEKRLRPKDFRSLRNLSQYKDMTDEEFIEAMSIRQEKKKETAYEENESTFADRAAQKLEEFEKDYDISDLKYNDRETLNSLISAMIMLENYEEIIHDLQTEGISVDNLTITDRVSKMASELRSDIIKYQDSLMISRKVRKSGSEESARTYLEDLKEKAREFYQSKMSYVFCPKCKMLLSTMWFLYPEEENNKIRLVCNRTLDDGTKCGTDVIVSSKELIKNRNKNISGIPEF